MLENQSRIDIIFPDEIIRDFFVEQYAYRVLSKFDKVFRLERDIEVIREAGEERELYFIYDILGCNVISENSRDSKRKVIFCHQGSSQEIEGALKIVVNRNLAQEYFEYQRDSYHLPIYYKEDIKNVLSVSGYSFYNINFILKQLFLKNLTLDTIKYYDQIMVTSSLDVTQKEIEQLSLVLQLNPKGIDRELLSEFLEKEFIQECLDKKYFFYNGTVFIGNIELYFKYSRQETLEEALLDRLLDRICSFIEKNLQKAFPSLLEHMIWIVSKLKKLDSFEQQIDKIEKYFFEKFRFTERKRLLEFIELCLEGFEKGKSIYIDFQVHRANLYMDAEEYKTAEAILDSVLKLSKRNRKLYYYVMDERVRLFERIERYMEALNGLYKVRNYYIREKDSSKKLRNVQNRIGENLYFTGEVKKAKECLENLFYVDVGAKIDASNVLTCEIANNLSLCYLEEGSYNRAIELMDKLYRIYLQTDNCPVNYATDILQNKGSVYLYTKEYNKAVKCFELALKDEKNPYSRQLILENYMYAKAMDEDDFKEAVIFFEEQCKTTISDETKRMLVEMYYGAGNFEECIKLSECLIPNMKRKKKLYDLFALIIFHAKSMVQCGKMGRAEKVKTLIQLEVCKVFAKKFIGEKSFYFNELSEGIRFLFQGENNGE